MMTKTRVKFPAYEKRATTGPVRVCFMIDRLSRAGTETQLLALIRSLDRSRVVPHLVLLDGASDESRSLEPDDCPILRLGLTSLFRPATLSAMIRLRRFWWQHHIDVLQTYFLDSTYFGVPFARICGIRKIVRVRNNLGYWLTKGHRQLGKWMGRLADVTLTNSDGGKQAIVEVEGLRPEKVAVLENGVDLDRFPQCDPPDTSRDVVRVGIVANLRTVKNIDGLIRAVALLRSTFLQSTRSHALRGNAVFDAPRRAPFEPSGTFNAQSRTTEESRRAGSIPTQSVGTRDVLIRAEGVPCPSSPTVRFEVAGEGEQRPELERLIAANDLDETFSLLGPVSDVPAFLARQDIAVLCSHSEGMSNALLEYMASGRAIIATDVGANARLIQDGVHGLIVPARDDAAIASAITKLLDNPETARQMGMTARLRVEADYSRTAMVRRFEDFYERLGAASG